MADKVKFLEKINPAKAIEEMLREQNKKMVQIYCGKAKDRFYSKIENIYAVANLY